VPCRGPNREHPRTDTAHCNSAHSFLTMRRVASLSGIHLFVYLMETIVRRSKCRLM
jgi:hypothetical protein